MVRPSFWALRTPALSSWARCRATTEKSTEQHSATSLTEHGRPHLIKHAKRAARVGSESDLNRSVSSVESIAARRRRAALGVFGFEGDAGMSMQVFGSSRTDASDLSPEWPFSRLRDHGQRVRGAPWSRECLRIHPVYCLRTRYRYSPCIRHHARF